jgi:poly(3-hydroxybutyrate) depolymerase
MRQSKSHFRIALKQGETMGSLKLLGLAVLLGLVSNAFMGAGDSSAAELYKRTTSIAGDTLGAGTELAMSLESGSSLILKDSGGTTATTCTGSEVKGKTEAGGTTVTMPVSTLTYSGCSDTTTVLKPGKIHIAWSSTTDGTVSWSESEVTVVSTAFGASAVCKAGASTTLGSLTGAKSETEQATLDVNAKISCGILGTATLTGTYKATSPTGLVVEGSATETELYKRTTSIAGDTLGAGTELAMSLESGSSLILKDSGGTTATTCTGSEVKGKTEAGGTTVTMPVSTLTYSGCSDTTTVLKPGKIHIAWSSTTDGTVSWSESEVTVVSTAFGASAVCKAGASTTLGSLTGAKSETEQATLDVNAKISCGILGTATLTGTYKATSPTGLVVEGS